MALTLTYDIRMFEAYTVLFPFIRHKLVYSLFISIDFVALLRFCVICIDDSDSFEIVSSVKTIFHLHLSYSFSLCFSEDWKQVVCDAQICV